MSEINRDAVLNMLASLSVQMELQRKQLEDLRRDFASFFDEGMSRSTAYINEHGVMRLSPDLTSHFIKDGKSYCGVFILKNKDGFVELLTDEQFCDLLDSSDTSKIVINTGYDDLCLSREAMSRYIELSQRPILTHDEIYEDCDGQAYQPYRHYTLNDEPFSDHNIERTDPALIQLVEETDGKCCDCGQLRVVEIPCDVEWEILTIGNTDGCSESVHEKHRVWT